MRRWRRSVIATIVAISPFTSWDGPTEAAAATKPAPESAVVNRFGGDNRYETAIAVSLADWGDDQAEAVVLARGDNFPDALAGVPLAVHVGGPLLISPPSALRADVRDEVRRVLPTGATVYMLGGTGALSPAIEAELISLGYRVDRLAGANRYETAIAVARALPPTDQITVATGLDFPDALAASVPAAEGMGTGGIPYPVLLTNGEELGRPTLNYVMELLKGTEILHINSVGGPAGVAAFEALSHHDKVRLQNFSGADRYSTATAIADYFYSTYATTRIGVTTGADFADALSAASRLAPKHAPLILTRPQSLPGPSAAKLEEYAFYGPLEIFGGPSAVSDQVADQAGVLVLPSAERAISLGEQVEVELDAAESIALSFEATKGDQLLVTVDGADDVVAATFFSPGLTKIGLSSILGGGNRPWDLYDPLVESGTFRLVFYSEYSDQRLNIVVSRPVDLPEHEIVPDGGPVSLTFGPGQAATLTYQSVADAGAVLHVTQPSTMCAQLAVRDANGALLVADRPCGAMDMRYDREIPVFRKGRHHLRPRIRITRVRLVRVALCRRHPGYQDLGRDRERRACEAM